MLASGCSATREICEKRKILSSLSRLPPQPCSPSPPAVTGHACPVVARVLPLLASDLPGLLRRCRARRRAGRARGMVIS